MHQCPNDIHMHSILIPASGSASRMKGLPKFLLPSGIDNLTLLEVHIRNTRNFASEILIGLNPKFSDIVTEAQLELHGARIIPLETKTMTETVLNLANETAADRFTTLMPDTIFDSVGSYRFDNLNHDLDLSLWRIRSDQYGKLGQVLLNAGNQVVDCKDKDPKCKYEFVWGALTFNRKFLELLNPEFASIGYGIVPAVTAKLEVYGTVLAGSYWDCGTPSEYVRYLRSSRF